MKGKMVVLLVVVSIIMTVCVGCSSNVTMPHSSKEYANGDWSIEELEKHFKDLGFSEIEVSGNTTEVIQVLTENYDSEFESFEKGAEIDTSRKIRIVTAFEEVPPLTVENCPEFAEFVEEGIESSENEDAWTTFLESHNGETLEFDGTITDWYDEMFWVSISFSIAIEDSEYMSFSKSGISLNDLNMTGDYHYNKYHAGLITEGMKVHVISKISQTEGRWCLELESMQVIE